VSESTKDVKIIATLFACINVSVLACLVTMRDCICTAGESVLSGAVVGADKSHTPPAIYFGLLSDASK
jgi:hypothetical protein